MILTGRISVLIVRLVLTFIHVSKLVYVINSVVFLRRYDGLPIYLKNNEKKKMV